MYNSILHFNEFGVAKIEKVIKKFMEDSSKDIGDLVMDLEKPLQELQRAIIKETIEEIDKIYRRDSCRKEKYNIERSGDENSILTTCGTVTYQRTYFKSKETGAYEYLADKAMGITANMRKSDDVVIKALNQVTDVSYRISGENATKTEDIISKQTVMKELHNLEIPTIIPAVKNKKKQRILYINADEDHVSLQFYKKKGDIRKNGASIKRNTIMPKLIYVFEGIEKEGPNSKRNRLVEKHYFGGVYKDNELLWEEVRAYIEAKYEEESLEKIYIMGDGASWIKKGLEVLGEKSIFVLDQFHLKQYIIRATGHLGDSIQDAKDMIYDAISFEDKKGIKEVFDKIADLAESESKRNQVLQTKRYILNHWKAIIIKNSDEDSRMGCSAEGSVSHIFSSRLSSRPLGWSKQGVDKMARLRIYTANGGNVYDLVKYKKEKQERIIKEEINKAIDKKIREKREQFTDVWNHQSISAAIGKRTGLYHATKALRGIC